jgi:hypothetical protein
MTRSSCDVGISLQLLQSLIAEDFSQPQLKHTAFMAFHSLIGYFVDWALWTSANIGHALSQELVF